MTKTQHRELIAIVAELKRIQFHAHRVGLHSIGHKLGDVVRVSAALAAGAGAGGDEEVDGG